MTAKDVEKSIGYCGLVCRLCNSANECGGCKTSQNCCSKHLSVEENGCFQYNCCVEKGINGCWECADFSCCEDMFGEGHDVRIRAFVKCAKEDGVHKLAEYVYNNHQKGIRYGYGKDYDNLGSEEAVLRLLRTGKEDR